MTSSRCTVAAAVLLLLTCMTSPCQSQGVFSAFVLSKLVLFHVIIIDIDSYRHDIRDIGEISSFITGMNEKTLKLRVCLIESFENFSKLTYTYTLNHSCLGDSRAMEVAIILCVLNQRKVHKCQKSKSLDNNIMQSEKSVFHRN